MNKVLLRDEAFWTAVAPSNIAFLKYWGKRDARLQWPASDSLSMSLTHAKTITSVQVVKDKTDFFNFEGKLVDSHSHPHLKVFHHISMLRSELAIEKYLYIETKNTFPSDCGIASSASGFAALTLAAAGALTGLSSCEDLAHHGINRERLAHWARRGSGSAGRSLFGGFVEWSAGASADDQKITPLYGAGHWPLSDIVVILSEGKKSVSSSEAHLAAWSSPFYAPRLAGTMERLQRIKKALRERNTQLLGEEIEAEALEMHAVAMTGKPAINYLLPETSAFISWVRQERGRGALKAWFTIDAGPNVHMICETENEEKVIAAVRKQWPQVKFIADRVGGEAELVRGDKV